MMVLGIMLLIVSFIAKAAILSTTGRLILAVVGPRCWFCGIDGACCGGTAGTTTDRRGPRQFSLTQK